MKARPNDNDIWQSELDEAKGLELGEKYCTSYACTEFSSAIGDVSRATIKDYLSSCKLIPVVVDGSKDSSITENEMVYTHTCHKGLVKQHLSNVVKPSMEQHRVLFLQLNDQ